MSRGQEAAGQNAAIVHGNPLCFSAAWNGLRPWYVPMRVRLLVLLLAAAAALAGQTREDRYILVLGGPPVAALTESRKDLRSAAAEDRLHKIEAAQTALASGLAARGIPVLARTQTLLKYPERGRLPTPLPLRRELPCLPVCLASEMERSKCVLAAPCLIHALRQRVTSSGFCRPRCFCSHSHARFHGQNSRSYVRQEKESPLAASSITYQQHGISATSPSSLPQVGARGNLHSR